MFLTSKCDKLHVNVTESTLTASINIIRKDRIISPELMTAIGIPYEYNNHEIKAVRIDKEEVIREWLEGIDQCIK